MGAPPNGLITQQVIEAMNPKAGVSVSTAADGSGAGANLQESVAGLRRPQKSLPCKYFYDERGSRLFEEICGLEEYYLTRTEMGILGARAGEMAEANVQGTVRDAPDVSGLSLLTVTLTAKQPIKLGILAYLQFRVATDAPKGMVLLRARSVQAASLDGQTQPLAKGRDGQVEIFERDEQIPLIGCFFFTH